MTDRPPEVPAASVPVRCSDCLQPFDPRDSGSSHRQRYAAPSSSRSRCSWSSSSSRWLSARRGPRWRPPP